MSEAEPHNADASIKYNHALLAKGGVLFAISAASMFWWHKFDSKKARTVAALTGLGGAFHVFRGIAPSQELLGSLESLSGGGSGGRQFVITDLNKMHGQDIRSLQKALEGKAQGNSGAGAKLLQVLSMGNDELRDEPPMSHQTGNQVLGSSDQPEPLETLLANQSLREPEKGHNKGSPDPKASDSKASSTSTSKVPKPYTHSPVSYVVDFDPYGMFSTDTSGKRRNHTAEFASTIQFLMKQARRGDEVIVRIASPGGRTFEYGYLAGLMSHLKSMGVDLTVTVDMLAASGGYLMACTADNIVAAPWAIVGSIGVVAELPNFNKALKRYDVDWQELTAGKHKRSLSPFGEVTKEGKEHVQHKIDDAYHKFTAFILHQRHTRLKKPIEELATGETWDAEDAKALGLVDVLGTSNALLHHRIGQRRVFHIAYRQDPFQGLFPTIGGALVQSLSTAMQQCLGLPAGHLPHHPFTHGLPLASSSGLDSQYGASAWTPLGPPQS